MTDDKPLSTESDAERTGFSRTLTRHGLRLTRDKTQILQINVACCATRPAAIAT